MVDCVRSLVSSFLACIELARGAQRSSASVLPLPSRSKAGRLRLARACRKTQVKRLGSLADKHETNLGCLTFRCLYNEDPASQDQSTGRFFPKLRYM